MMRSATLARVGVGATVLLTASVVIVGLQQRAVQAQSDGASQPQAQTPPHAKPQTPAKAQSPVKPQPEAAASARVTLKPVSAFSSIAEPSKRSLALFEEAGKVITHPRCVNCHPAGDRPLQGMDQHPHLPFARRGTDGHGVAAMRCDTCHQSANFEGAGGVGVPGHAQWHLAPIEMAWQGKTLGQICRQIKDPGRNGGRTLAQIVEHMSEDSLVGWAWNPGTGRVPAPGTQKSFGALARAWAESGAACPPS
jgi:hypothetical protein